MNVKNAFSRTRIAERTENGAGYLPATNIHIKPNKLEET
jgi:hypothetical protein